MSADNKTNNGFWSSLGKAGVLVGLIWGGIQIYNYFFKTGDFEAEANGRHTFYKTAPIILDGYKQNINTRAIVKTVIDADGFLKTYNYEKLKHKIDDDYRYLAYSSNYDRINPVKDYRWNGDFTTMWTFKIKNYGNKPLEELALELPFNGYYKVKFPDNTTKVDSFANKINLKELRPSYELSITCWTDNDTYDPESDEEKSRLTHKNGWFSISYPLEVKADSIYALNTKYHGMPIFVFFVIVFFLFIVIYATGESNGLKKQKNEVPLTNPEVSAKENEKQL